MYRSSSFLPVKKFLPYLLLAGLLTPLVFGKELLFPFIVYRTYFFYAVVDLALFLWLWSGGWRELRKIRQSRVALALGLFLLAKLISDILGEDPWSSIFGDYERMMGWFTWLHIGLFTVLLASVFDTSKYERVIKTAVAVALLVSLYGIGQHLGVGFAARISDPRLFSTIGNPAFLAGFLLLSGFWAVFLAWQAGTNTGRWIGIIATAVIGWALYLTATRGALLSAYVGTIILIGYAALYYVVRDGDREGESRRWKWHLLGGALGILVFLPLLVLGLARTPLAARSLALRRLATISLTDQSAQSRLFLWRGAWAGIQERPLTGYGEYHIRTVLDRLYDPKIFEKWFDSSHNIIVDLALAHGLLGLLSGGRLFLNLVRVCHRYRGVDRRGAGVGLAIIVAYLVQGQFIFDTLVGLIPLAVLAAWCIRVETEAAVAPSRTREHSSERPWTDNLVRGAGILLILVAFAWYRQGWRALAAVTEGHRILERGGKTSEAVPYFEQGITQARFGFTSLAALIRSNAVRAIGAAGAIGQEVDPKLLDVVRQAHQIARAKDPPTSQQFVDEARVYLAVPNPPPALAARAEELLKTAIMLSPARADSYYALAQLYADQNQLAAADELLAPLFDRFGRERPEVSREIAWRRAQIARAQGDNARAAEQLALAVEYGILRSLAEFEPFVAQAVAQKNWPAAKAILGLMLMVDAGSDRVLANLAQVHRELGEFDAARVVAERLRALHPETAEDVDEFLQTLPPK